MMELVFYIKMFSSEVESLLEKANNVISELR
jgi:hypothetical protein